MPEYHSMRNHVHSNPMGRTPCTGFTKPISDTTQHRYIAEDPVLHSVYFIIFVGLNEKAITVVIYIQDFNLLTREQFNSYYLVGIISYGQAISCMQDTRNFHLN